MQPTRRDVHIDTALSNIAIAYRNADYIANKVFPIVPVKHVSDKYFIFTPAAWFRDEAAVRAPGTRAYRGDYELSTGSYVCIEYALAKGIPDEVRENADDPLKPEVEAVEWVTDKLLLAMERRVAAIVTASTGRWATATSPAVAWSNDTSDPLGDIEAAKYTILQSIGRMPNTMVVAASVWRHLRNHPDLLDRIKYTERGVLTLDLFKSLVEIPNILLGTAIYDASIEGQTSNMKWVWGANVWIGWVPARPALWEPAAGYVFQWKAFETRRFREEQERQDVVETLHAVAEVVTASTAGYVIYNAV